MNEKYIVIRGGLQTGLTVWGPFESRDAAEEWAVQNPRGSHEIFPINTPGEISNATGDET